MLKQHLEGKHIILASKSPRRQQLLKGLDIDFEVRTKDVDESYPTSLKDLEIPEYLAKKKADAFIDELKENDILITCDTIVSLNGEVLEKPSDYTHAFDMLSKLSGKMHTVYTGVCITTKNSQTSFTDKTEVYFKSLSKEEIDYYITHYKPYDKAGSYGIQEWWGYVAIEKINGDFFNVMGLPLRLVYEKLKKIKD
jgi:septum formation protein